MDRLKNVILIGDSIRKTNRVIVAYEDSLSWGYGSEIELLRAGAVALADAPSDVADLVMEPYRLHDR